MPNNSITANFVREKETKNTIRFQEEVGENPPIIGTLYVQKFAVNKLGNPNKLTVTITVG